MKVRQNVPRNLPWCKTVYFLSTSNCLSFSLDHFPARCYCFLVEWPQESCVYSLSSCQVSIQLFDNGWENSAGKFKKGPASLHRFSIPARRSMLLLRWNIMFLLMIHQELDQSPECHWMSVTLWSWRKSEGGKADSIGCLYEFLEFLIWGGKIDDIHTQLDHMTWQKLWLGVTFVTPLLSSTT